LVEAVPATENRSVGGSIPPLAPLKSTTYRFKLFAV
jgi:hypothetical protein